MKYGEAMGDSECKAQYHKSKGAGFQMQGGKIKMGKVFKKINTKVKDVVASKGTKQYLNAVKKTGQVVSTGLNYVQKSGLADEIPFANEGIDLVRGGIKKQNRGINYLQDQRQNLVDKRQQRKLNGGSFKSFNGGSFNFQGGAMPMNDKYEAVYGNTNGIDRNAQTFYPNPYDTKSLRESMFGHR
jgi:hypothetical protein